jgi:hypothetical protein
MEIKSRFLDKHSDISHFSSEMNGNTSWFENKTNVNVSCLKSKENQEQSIAEYRLAVFSKLVDDRKNYLNQLLNLPDNWISGKSNIPNQYAVNTGQKILNGFLSYLNLKKESVFIPKLIIGPIPSGGISIELHRDSGIALYFNIFNNENVEVEMKYFDFYSDIEIKNTNEGLLRQYDLFIEDSAGNSGRGNPVSVYKSSYFS